MKYPFLFALTALIFSCGTSEQAKRNNTQDIRLEAVEKEMARLIQFEKDAILRDSLQEAKFNAIAPILVYHDSLLSDRVYKRDRARRRGEFLGGIIKGIVK